MLAAVAGWWDARAQARSAYAMAAAIGLGSMLAIYGAGFVLGTSSYWDLPTPDHRMYLMGYRYFAGEPWHWPLFDTATALPHVRSIAFSDTPLAWAVVNKLVATIAPPWRDYSEHALLGLWYGLASALQAILAVACLRALGHLRRGEAITTSLFAIAIPAWTYRLPHASLYAHFFLLWAIYLYLTRARRGWLVQLGVVALSNAYLTVMSLAVFAASLARRPNRRSAAWLAAGCAIVVTALALAGYFSGEATTATHGYSAAGSNLLGPILPMDSGWFGRRAWVDVTGLQYEGVCYLGLGILVLAVVTLRARDVLATARRHLALAITGAAMIVLALSNHIYIGSHRVAAYPIPHLLHWIPDQFRCPGRFSWLPMYAAVIFLLSRGFTRFRAGWRRLVLPALAILQLVDVSGDWHQWRGVMHDAGPSSLDVPRWRALLAGASAIEIYPANDCYGDRSFDQVTQIQFLASERAIPINSIYTARPSRDCDGDIADLVELHPQPGRVYVFVAPALGFAKRLAATTDLPCADAGFAEVCHTDRTLIDSLGWPATPAPTALRFGDAIELADPAADYLEFGWASSEPDGRWTDGATARLVFRPAGDPPANPLLHIEAHAMLCGSRADNDLDIAVDGTRIGSLHFTDSTTQSVALPIPPELLTHPIVEIEMRPRDYRSPHAAGCRSDTTREISVKVTRVSIASAR